MKYSSKSPQNLYTTYELLRKAGACGGRYRHLARALGGITAYGQDTPITVLTVLEHSGLDDALWALRAVPPEQAAERDRMARHLACDYAEHIAPLWGTPPGIDWAPADCIAVARRYADGQATVADLSAAGTAAWAAGAAAGNAAWWAAGNAAWAAMDAAWAAAGNAAGGAAWAARDAAWAAGAAAWAAGAAAGDAAGDAAWAAGAAAGTAEREWQAQRLRERLAQ